MMKKINELNDIESISTFYRGMAMGYGKQKNVLFISEENGSIVDKIPFQRNLLEIMEDKLFLSNTDLYVYDEELQDFILYRKSLEGGRVNLFNGNFIENKYTRSSESVQVTMYNGKSDVKLWEKIYSDRISWFCRGNHLYVTDLMHEYIDFIDARTGGVLNTLHFENPPISRFIYYYKDTLIVSLEIKPLEEYRLLGLDARTGEEKWSIEDADYRYIQDPMTGYLYDIGGKRFNVVDPGEGKILYKGDMTAENKKFDILPEWGILGKNSIYFIDNFPRSRVGRIDLKTYKIEFVVDLNFSNGVKITDLSYHNGRLYILDTDKTLHIFAEE